MINCKNIENAKRVQLQKNCTHFKKHKKTKIDCRTKSSMLLKLSKTLCSFYTHTLTEDATQNHRARIETNTSFDFSKYNEALARQEAFPSDNDSLEKVASLIFRKIIECNTKFPEIETFDVICIGTGMNTKPEHYLYTYLQKYLIEKDLKFRFLICDPNYSDENITSIKTQFNENVTVVKTLPDPTKLNYAYGKIVIAFSGIDEWIRKAYDVFKFMINMWYIISDRCQSGEKSAIIDIFFTRHFGERYQNIVSDDKVHFGNFWAIKLTDVLYNHSHFRFSLDDSPKRAKQFALDYTCTDENIINPKIQ